MAGISTATGEATRDRDRPSTLAAQTTAFLLVLLVAYVLSPGPGIWMLTRIGGTNFDERWGWALLPWVPLIWACDLVPAVRAFYEWYMPFWGV